MLVLRHCFLLSLPSVSLLGPPISPSLSNGDENRQNETYTHDLESVIGSCQCERQRNPHTPPQRERRRRRSESHHERRCEHHPTCQV